MGDESCDWTAITGLILRLTASRVDSEAPLTGTLFLERLRQEESRFRSLGEFPIGAFLCVTSVAREADTATPFGAIDNIPSVGSDVESMAIEDLGLVAFELSLTYLPYAKANLRVVCSLS
jgi:hypothetical protein